MNDSLARLLISCADQPGIVAAVSSWLYEHGANIVQSDQYSTDPFGGRYFMRIEFALPNVANRLDELNASFEPIAERFQMTWRLKLASEQKRMAIFVSREDHCLLELLWRWQSGELPVKIPLVISNHPDLRSRVENFRIPFYHIPVLPGRKTEAEAKALELMAGKVDFIVLARYMQVLSPLVLEAYPYQIINIHHSFLPAFKGARPYHQAYERGVKLIGATAHYATEALDQGPIIEQDVVRVSHRDKPEDLKQKGRYVERMVLANAVRLHIEDRVIVEGNKTIVFN